ncbi:MAG: hypothetical protein K8U57_21460 [Planctomycetes bacterium]|nr:hypothetical protein [Planctomycetota bacterium]
MATQHVRSLLTLGNWKVGESIHIWSLPAVETCPGSSSLCRAVCYATKGRYLFDAVRERLAWNLEQARRDDFVPRMVKEIRRKGCLVIRVHSAGDFFDEVYAGKWLEIMRTCPKPRYYWYSRSWRCPEIASVLEQMAALKCCRAWYSIDTETGIPDPVPFGVRLAFLQVKKDERPELADMTFRIRRLRKESRVGLPMVCPSETPKGRERDTNCGNCRRCFT